MAAVFCKTIILVEWTGNPVQKANVNISTIPPKETDQRGKAGFDLVKGRQYDLKVVGEDYAPKEVSFIANDGVLKVDIVLQPSLMQQPIKAMKIEKDEDGIDKPAVLLPGITITATLIDKRTSLYAIENKTLTCVTGIDGRCMLHKVVENLTYHVEAKGEGVDSFSESTVFSGLELTISLTADIIRIAQPFQIRDVFGSGLAGAKISIFGNPDIEPVETDPSGTGELKDLIHGRKYPLRVILPNYDSFVDNIFIAGSKSTEYITLNLTPTFTKIEMSLLDKGEREVISVNPGESYILKGALSGGDNQVIQNAQIVFTRVVDNSIIGGGRTDRRGEVALSWQPGPKDIEERNIALKATFAGVVSQKASFSGCESNPVYLQIE